MTSLRGRGATLCVRSKDSAEVVHVQENAEVVPHGYRAAERHSGSFADAPAASAAVSTGLMQGCAITPTTEAAPPSFPSSLSSVLGTSDTEIRDLRRSEVSVVRREGQPGKVLAESALRGCRNCKTAASA